jgi:YaiO family outer membrane protein
MIAVPMLLLAASLTLPSASPAPTPDPSFDYQSGVIHESLSNNYPSWDTQYLRIVKKAADNQTFYTELDTTSRYGKQDDQFVLGMYVPLSPQWMFFGEGSASNSHLILPSSSVSAGAFYNSGGNWFEGVTARHTEYDAASVNAAVFSLEHYWRYFRAYYSVTAADLAGTGTDVEHFIELDRYYGKQQNSYVGIGYTGGREVESTGLPQLLTSHVHGWNILGRHWVDDHWAVMYGVGSFTQGTLYTRTGGYLGIDYRF